MKIAIVTESGSASFLKQELLQKFNIKSEDKGFFVLADLDKKELLKTLYLTQCSKYFLLNPCFGSFKDLIDLKEKIVLEDSKNVKILCERTGDHDFKSVDVISEVAKKLKTDLDNYDFQFRIIIDNNNFISGLDVSGRDLSKREYRVFNHPNSLNGLTVACALAFSEVSKKTVLDPLSLSGEIAIETVFYKANISPHYFNKDFDIFKLEEFNDLKDYLNEIDDLIKKSKEFFVYSFDPKHKNINAQKKNSRIAGVDKYIEYSRFDSDDVDLKSYKKTPDIIITRPLEPSKKITEESALKINESLLHRTKEFMNPCEITFICRKPSFVREMLKNNGFNIIKEATIKQGKDTYGLINSKR